jgi:hypothetical protein
MKDLYAATCISASTDADSVFASALNAVTLDRRRRSSLRSVENVDQSQKSGSKLNLAPELRAIITGFLIAAGGGSEAGLVQTERE